MKLTEKEVQVLLSFDTYKTLEGTISDLGVSWTGAADIAEKTGLSLKSVKGILGSLVKKGLVHADDEPGIPQAQCLTEEGAKEHFAQFGEAPAEEEAAEEEVAPEAPVVEVCDTPEFFLMTFRAAGGFEPRCICKGLRAVARVWKGQRASFVEAAVACGLSAGNAAAEWQQSTRRAD